MFNHLFCLCDFERICLGNEWKEVLCVDFVFGKVINHSWMVSGQKDAAKRKMF